MNHPVVQAAMIATNGEFRAELHLVDQAHNNGAGNTQIELVTYWDRWIRDDLRTAARDAQAWIATWTLTLRNFWAVRTDMDVVAILQVIITLRSLGSDMEIIVDGLSQGPFQAWIPNPSHD